MQKYDQAATKCAVFWSNWH